MRRAKDEGRPFKFAILDLTIPGGSGGREIIGELLAIDDAHFFRNKQATIAELQFTMDTFSVGRLTRRPSASLPDLMTMPSSPVSM